MTFIVHMALREIRASWQRLLFFFVCIAVGVAAIVAIRSVIQTARVALTREARAMTGGDLVIGGNNLPTPAVRDAIANIRKAGVIGTSTEVAELATMVRPGGATATVTKMVELKAVGPEFPLYGTLTLKDGTYSHALLRGRGVIVRPELLAQLGVAVGERLLIGKETFEVRGVIDAEPGRNFGAFTIGSRVFIDSGDLAATGLVSFGSRVSHELLITVNGDRRVANQLADDLRGTLANEFVRVRSYAQNEDNISRSLARAENYLSLVGLVVLILGGIGVSSVTRVFVQQKVRSIAILKCIGCTTSMVLGVYMTQVLLLGFTGSALGVAIAAGVIAALPSFVGDLGALLSVEYGVTVGAVLQGLAIGMLVSILFSIVPLLEVRNVKPSLLLRQDTATVGRIDWLKWTVTAAVASALIGVAAWQAGSLRVGLVLSAGFIGVAIVLHLAGIALVRAVQPLRFARSFALRQAVLHVARPGNQTRVILLAVGLGTFFILGVRSLQVNLLRDFSVQMGEDAPDMFLIDVQLGQRDALMAYVDRENGDEPGPRLIPVLRARVVGVEGKNLNLENYQEVRGRGSLRREFTVTYRSALEENETIVDGAWWGDAGGGEPEVSIEAEFLERERIQVGDRMRFDVLGREITARVASIRRVNWDDFRAGGFMFVFKPGTFDGAPHTFISSAKGPRDPAARLRMQAGLVTQFPNVSVIDLREVMQSIQTIVANVTLAVTVVGALVLFSGALILVGAVSMTKYRRIYEAAILKTLGASGRLIATMLVLEYGVLGVIAGTVGAVGAIGLSWGVARFALEMPWESAGWLTATGIVVTAVFVAAVGVLASLDVLRHKPLATLRAE